MRGRGKSVRRNLGVAAGVVVLLLVLAQLLLPGIAARRIRTRVGRYGTVKSVSVSAWPAVKVLWGSADSVTVRAASLRLSTAQTASALKESGSAGRVTLTAEHVQVGVARVSDATLVKHGDALSAGATVTAQEVKAALPEGVGVQLLESAGGRVRARVSGALFGVAATVEAIAEASDGELVVHPVGFLIEGFRLVLFAEPHVYIEGVGAQADAAAPSGYRVTVTARLE
jgi:hypothetical protein